MQNYVDNLVKNKHLRNEEEIILFEDAIDKIFKIKNKEALRNLFLGFEDNTECEEVMFNLVHAVEDYAETLGDTAYITIFINAIPEILKDAHDWIIILICRIMNEDESFIQFVKIANESDLEDKIILIDLFNDIKNEDYEKFGKKAEFFIQNVKY